MVLVMETASVGGPGLGMAGLGVDEDQWGCLQHFLYLAPEPHQHVALRGGGQGIIASGGTVWMYRVLTAASVGSASVRWAKSTSSATVTGTICMSRAPLSARFRQRASAAG